MSSRKTEPDKSAAPAAKKTPPAAKTAASKTKTTSSSARVKLGVSPTATLKTVEPKRASAGTPKGVVAIAGSNPEASVEQVCQVSMVAKPVSGTKIVKKVIRKVIRKVPASARVASAHTSALRSVDRANEETPKEKTSKDIKNTEVGNNEPAADDDCLFENVEPSKLENENMGNHKRCFQKEEQDVGDPEKHFMGSGENLPEAIEPLVIDRRPVDAQEPCATNEKKELKEELEDQIEIIDKGDLKVETIDMEDSSDQMKLENAFLDEHDDGKIEGLSDQEVHEEFEGEDLADDDAPENEA